MEHKLSGILLDIKEQTGLDICIYDAGGALVVSGRDKVLPCPEVGRTQYEGGVFADKDKDVTGFVCHCDSGTFTGVVEGSGDIARNYAFMLSVMLESALAQEDKMSRREALRSILTGEAGHFRIQKALRTRLVQSMPCFVLAIVCDPRRSEDAEQYLVQLAGEGSDAWVQTEDDLFAYVKYIHDESEYQSASDFANMLAENMAQEALPVRIGVGSYAKSAAALSEAYSQAAGAVRMGGLAGGGASVYSYKEFLLMRMIEDIPKATLSKYLDQLLDNGARDILKDADMLSTAEEFLQSSLNISETSRKLYMHRNTLMYRLDKIERAMGLDIRKFSDAVTFRLMLALYRHLD